MGNTPSTTQNNNNNNNIIQTQQPSVTNNSSPNIFFDSNFPYNTSPHPKKQFDYDVNGLWKNFPTGESVDSKLDLNKYTPQLTGYNDLDIDALVFTDIKNNLTSDMMNSNKLSGRFSVNDPSKTQEYLNNLLIDTTIKRACCMYHNRPGTTGDKYPVTVRLPIPDDSYNFGDNPKADTWKKFGFIDETVYVPKILCEQSVPDFNYQTNKCQDFMALYCTNVKEFYREELNTTGGKYTDDGFYDFKPECACYGDQPSYLTGTVPPTCYLPGCNETNSNVFVDSLSRKGCPLTICTTNLNLAELKAGGSVNVNSQIQQKCGNELSQLQNQQNNTKGQETISVPENEKINVVQEKTTDKTSTTPIVNPTTTPIVNPTTTPIVNPTTTPIVNPTTTPVIDSSSKVNYVTLFIAIFIVVIFLILFIYFMKKRN